jgi:hypothetical protein
LDEILFTIQGLKIFAANFFAETVTQKNGFLVDLRGHSVEDLDEGVGHLREVVHVAHELVAGHLQILGLLSHFTLMAHTFLNFL